MNNKVTKVVVAAAGLGTRFLPQTKAMPKEMLPIVDRPVIQILVEQMVEAGVEDVVIVTGAQKRALEDHFDRSVELEHDLIRSGKKEKAAEIKRIAELANFIYIRQKGSYGTARPLLNARHIVQDSPFYYIFADDFFTSEVSAAAQMLEAHKKTGKIVLALTEVPESDTNKYGVIDPGEALGDNLFEVKSIVEKPAQGESPSNLASVHGYLMTPEIFDYIDEDKISSRGEVEIQPAINELAAKGKVVGLVVKGDFHDAGSIDKYLEAVVDMALNDKRVSKTFRKYLENRLAKND